MFEPAYLSRVRRVHAGRNTGNTLFLEQEVRTQHAVPTQWPHTSPRPTSLAGSSVEYAIVRRRLQVSVDGKIAHNPEYYCCLMEHKP
jgi:hypothetical protein